MERLFLHVIIPTGAMRERATLQKGSYAKQACLIVQEVDLELMVIVNLRTQNHCS